MSAPKMTKTEFAELLKIANDQLAATVCAHIQAAQAEMNRRFEDLDKRLDRLEARLGCAEVEGAKAEE